MIKDKDALLIRGYAETMEEWWFLLDSHKDNIERLMINFLNPHELKEMREALESRDANTIWMQLNRLWDKLPDSPSIHSFEGFAPLCDLCSDFPINEEKEGEK